MLAFAQKLLLGVAQKLLASRKSSSFTRKSSSLAPMADYDRSFKILLVGDAGVGKSALLQRFVERHHATHHVPTLGVDFRLRTIGLNGERIKLHVFDTSGQDRSQNIARAHYRSAEGVLLCYDLSSDESLQNVARWEEAIRQYAPPGVPVVLVGLKADAAVASNTLPPHAIEASAVTGEGVDAAFERLAQEIRVRPAARESAARATPSEVDGGCLGGCCGWLSLFGAPPPTSYLGVRRAEASPAHAVQMMPRVVGVA